VNPHQAPPQAGAPHVLAVDDDPAIRELIADYLGQNEFRVTAVANGRAMQEVLAEQVVDLVVLDLKLQAEDGMALARRLRDESSIPIIMLTGRVEEADRVMGLELGADDYLTKPFSPRELLARIRTILRRRRAEVRQGRPDGVRAYRFDGWELNLNTRRLTAAGGRAVPLSNGEFSLLVVFRGCTTTRSTTARWTCRSCACGASSSPIRRSRATSGPSAAPATCSGCRSKRCTDRILRKARLANRRAAKPGSQRARRTRLPARHPHRGRRRSPEAQAMGGTWCDPARGSLHEDVLRQSGRYS
jgi:two-component system, OmpR family, response regulator